MDFKLIFKLCQENLIGLDKEIRLILAAINSHIPTVIEGESGVGKTELVKTIANALNRPFFRVDGDENLTITHLRGWFDPPLVMKTGFGEKSFIPGPLVNSMQQGGLFFFNEVNRAPSESINGVLAALDERQIEIPQLGRVQATKEFYSIFARNPSEYIGTNPLPEAFFDRCILVRLKHKSGEEAEKIVKLRTNCSDNDLITKVVLFTDQTRVSPYFEAGASVRAAIQLTQLLKNRSMTPEHVYPAINAVYAGKVRLHPDITKGIEDCLFEIAEPIFFPPDSKKF
ncbi:MAG: MoxR family ATPase [Candidatus Heimdallarchaeota archaeon]|nr:MAG: MoxR family ATPase [Candidatus Heimdallarchaeota archaeon]